MTGSPYRFLRRVEVPTTADELFRWHERPGILERLMPPWEKAEVLQHEGNIRDGARATVRLHVGPLSFDWKLRHQGYEQGRQFQDVQTHGLFASWQHTHRMLPGPVHCTLEDDIEYRLPFGALGHLGRRWIEARLDRLFRFRHRITRQDHELWNKDATPMHIAMTGASGLVGSAASAYLQSHGHRVTPMIRGRAPREGEILWNSERPDWDPSGLEGVDAVLHLAGENIAARRWSNEQKTRIRRSREAGTRSLVTALGQLKTPPKTLLSASAVGFYGHREDEVLTESSPAGEGFLPEVCQEWEDAARVAEGKGIRVVALRLGVVLSPRGGALKTMLLPFRLGLGGPIGSGRQFMSWVSIEDIGPIVDHALQHAEITGPVNAVAPAAVSNKEFTRTLGRVLRRPAFFPLPAPIARLALGEVADALLLASAHVKPGVLEATGYTYRHTELETCLRDLLGKPG